MNKLIRFAKENKIICFALFLVILSLGLLFVPGFARDVLVGDTFKYKLSGYEAFFNTRYTAASVLETKVLKGVCGAGIALFVLLVLSFFGLCFSKKSSFVMALTGLALLVVSILFFTMEPSLRKVLNHIPYDDKYVCGWIVYVLGAITLLASALVIYKTVLVMKDEVKHPTKAKGPTYNYLKK